MTELIKLIKCFSNAESACKSLNGHQMILDTFRFYVKTKHRYRCTIKNNFSQLIPTDESMNWVRFVLLLTSFQDIVIVRGDYLIETEDVNPLIGTNNIGRDYVYEASR